MKKPVWQVCLVVFGLLSSNILFSQNKVMLCTGKYSHSYHKYHCRGLKQCKATIVTVTLEAAIKDKHDPCDFCYGPNAVPVERRKASSAGTETSRQSTQFAPGVPLRSNTTATESRRFSTQVSSQCNATTKKGTRCSRNASAGGYCWQHKK